MPISQLTFDMDPRPPDANKQSSIQVVNVNEVGKSRSSDMEPKVPLGTLGEALRSRALSSPEDLALVASAYDPLSYGQLATQLDHFSAALRDAGLGGDAHVAVAIPDSPQAALAIVCISCATVAVPLDPKLTPNELETRLGLLGLDAIMIRANDDSPLRSSAELHGIPIIEAAPAPGRELGFRLTLVTSRTALPKLNGEPEPNSPAFILQSSGTTAEPKLVPYSHQNMLAAAKRVAGWFKLTANDRCLSISPAYYSHGLKLTVLTSLLSGGSVAFPKNLHRVDIKEWLVSLNPSWFSANPTTHRAILEKAQLHREELKHRLRFALSGGSALDPDVQQRLQTTLSVPILEHYGTTEAAQISTNLPPPGPGKRGSCGVPAPGSIMIVGEQGAELPPGEWGEILVRGPTVVDKYLNNPELTKASFVDGWYRTGDIGSLDEEGFLTLRGRLIEIINRGGEKISPMEVEAALLRHPDVLEAAVFSVPHNRLGQDVAAAAVLYSHASVTSDDLRDFLSKQLAWFKIPRRVQIVEALPKGATGKVSRRKLSEIYR